MTKKKHQILIEIIFTIFAVISISFLSTSLINDFRLDKSKLDIDKISSSNQVISSLLKRNPQENPISLNDLKKYKEVIEFTPDIIPSDFYSSLPKLSPQQTDQEIRRKLIDQRLKNVEVRIKNLEDKSEDGLWSALKAILIWLLVTFFTPIISDLGKKAFNIESK